MPRAAHSTVEGALRLVQLPAARPELLALDMACKPLSYACDAMGVRCERLELALHQVYAGGGGSKAKTKRQRQSATMAVAEQVGKLTTPDA